MKELRKTEYLRNKEKTSKICSKISVNTPERPLRCDKFNMVIISIVGVSRCIIVNFKHFLILL